MKRLLTILGASLFLVGCGSQNLGPLEDKTTNLRDENHNLKLKIQQLNQDINNQKSQLEALNKDKKDVSKTVDNNNEANFLQASSNYYKDIAKIIDKFNQLDLNKTKKDDKNQNLEKLNSLSNDIDDTYSKYKSDTDKGNISNDNTNEDRNIKQINKNLQSAFKDIKNGYESNNKKKINQGKMKLSQINVSSSS